MINVFSNHPRWTLPGHVLEKNLNNIILVNYVIFACMKFSRILRVRWSLEITFPWKFIGLVNADRTLGKCDNVKLKCSEIYTFQSGKIKGQQRCFIVISVWNIQFFETRLVRTCGCITHMSSGTFNRQKLMQTCTVKGVLFCSWIYLPWSPKSSQHCPDFIGRRSFGQGQDIPQTVCLQPQKFCW